MGSRKISFDRIVDFLCRESLPRRVVRFLSVFSGRLNDPDHVSMLRHHPLGMFFYNLRFLVFLVSGMLLLLCAAAGRIRGETGFFWTVIFSLVSIWGIGVIFTLLLHRSFRATLDSWSTEIGNDSFPRAFRRYFVFDAVLVIMVFALGRVLSTIRPEYAFDAFCWLLLANTIVYTGYDLNTIYSRYRSVLILPALVALLLLIDVSASNLPTWLVVALQAAPIAAACIVSVFAVYAITRARRLDAARVDEYITTLGGVGAILAPPDFATTAQLADNRLYHEYREQQCRARLSEALRLVCAHDNFWFRSACLWLVEQHKDRHGVLLPEAAVNFEEADHFPEGINVDSGFLAGDDVVLVRALSQVSSGEASQALWRFRTDQDVPAAITPIMHDGKKIGVLVVYGNDREVPVVAADRTFLLSLGAMIATALSQWETFLRALALTELDELFTCRTMPDLLSRSAALLKRSMAARGSMIIFRPDPQASSMITLAADGSESALTGLKYEVGIGKTGECAAKGTIERIDDVSLHRHEFEPKLLRRIERAYSSPLTSWMAIPIGGADNNHGVIKVVDSLYPWKWFTAYDERLGKDIATRLLVMIEKLRYVESVEAAHRAAQESAADAQRSAAEAQRSAKDARASEELARAAQKRAEETAERRHQDIMTVMHQLQAPLLAISNALTAIDMDTVTSFVGEMLTYATALVEDALNLGFGTVTVFANESGKRTMFQEAEIDARVQMEGLAQRLQRTQLREDLRFTFKQEPGFPLLKMDAAVFASVFYSLIHNAMKYADDKSEVVLECGFEYPGGKRRPALKVKTIGKPIAPDERERVFQKFERGRSVERGVRHKGVGLGLWVARGLMTMLNGTLTLELSDEFPKISIFVVQLGSVDR